MEKQKTHFADDETISYISKIERERGEAVALIRRISLAEADELDGARDTALLKKAIRLCRDFMEKVEQ